MPKVLVIENEPNVLKLAEVNLTASGYKVLVASNGEDGLRRAQLEHPQLILLDLMMPGMSGWDVLMSLKVNPKLRKIPVIVMTAVVLEDQDTKIRSMRAAAYIMKPFSADELLDQVKQALGR